MTHRRPQPEGVGEKRARRTQISPFPNLLLFRESLPELPWSPHFFLLKIIFKSYLLVFQQRCI